MSGNPAKIRPPWWATLGLVLVGGACLTAGAWQLSRAAEKRALLQSFDAAVEGALPPPGTAGENLSALRYRALTASGRYDAARQVLLDARTRDGQAGYEILTPLLAGDRAILVNRGWLAADPDRSRLPDLSVGEDQRAVHGLLDRLPRPALAVAPDPPAGDAPWPRRLLYPTAEQISAALGYRVENYQILLAPEAPDGYRRDWRPAAMTPRQHLGYAVQWFALAATLVVIYAFLGFRRASPGKDAA